MATPMEVTTVDIISVITSASAILLSFGSIFGFYSQKIREAESRGEMMQRLSEVARKAASTVEHFNELINNHNASTVSLAQQAEAISYIKAKIDDMANWYAELSKTMTDIARHLPREPK